VNWAEAQRSRALFPAALADDRTRGGHLMSCVPRKVRVGIQYIRRLELALPITLDYLTQDFTRDAAKDLDEAE